ncbi:MAG: four helix bundle protein [Candidatus Paceibacterota bacterium]|jgi:four helix bundle protein
MDIRDTKTEKIRSFKDLRAWQRAHDLAIQTYLLTKKFPKEELFGITNQMRRAAVSVPSNLAEGFSRKSSKEKTQFYAISKGSLTELESQYLISRDLGYVSGQEFADIEGKIEQVGKIITGLAKSTRIERAL